MLKLPFRYALSTLYAKLLIDDLYLAFYAATAASWHHYLVWFDPLTQYQYQHSVQRHPPSQHFDKRSNTDYAPDEKVSQLAEEARIDLKAGEFQVFFWDRMNAGYVFRRIFLPSNWREFLSEKELKSIIGHEIGHLKLGSDSMIPMRIVNRFGDELLYTLLPVHAMGIFLLLLSLIAQNPAYFKALSLTIIFRLVHMLIENHYARKDEYKADQFGKRVSSAESMIAALIKMDRSARAEAFENFNHLSHSKQSYYHWLLKKDKGRLRELFLDHPLLYKRIRALKA